MASRLLVLLVWSLLFEFKLNAEPIRFAVMQLSEHEESWKAPNLEVARNFCSKAQVNCEIVALPNQRAFKELQANRVQFVLSLDHQIPGLTPHKIAKADSVSIVVIAKKPTPDCESLKGMNLASFRNVFYAKKLAKKCPGLKLTWTNTYVQGMRMYRSGRVDGMIGVELNFKRSKQAPVQLTKDDNLSQVGREDVWLFGNISSKTSEAAGLFLTALAKDHSLFHSE